MVLIIMNCFNVVSTESSKDERHNPSNGFHANKLDLIFSFPQICSIIHIAVTILNYSEAPEVESMVMNYISMVISGICCAAAFVESTSVLEIVSDIEHTLRQNQRWLFVTSMKLFG